jgi:hypothetical protein
MSWEYRDQSVIGCLGYKTGAKGLLETARRQKLRVAITQDLSVALEDEEYLSARGGQYGQPLSEARVLRVAEDVALPLNQLDLRRPELADMIRHRTSDLRYLKEKYGHLLSCWPHEHFCKMTTEQTPGDTT